MQEPLNCDDQAGDDILPIWVPAGTFLATFGFLLFRGVCRSCIHQAEKFETSKQVTEIILVFAINTLVLSLIQLGVFEVAYIGSYCITAAIVISNLKNLMAFSQQRVGADREEQSPWRIFEEEALPSLFFSKAFRKEVGEKINSSESGPLLAIDKYADFADSGFIATLLLGSLQLVFIVVYAGGIFRQGTPCLKNRDDNAYYWLGILLQGLYVSSTGALTRTFDNYAYWLNIFRLARSNDRALVLASEVGNKGSMGRSFGKSLRYDDPKLWIRYIVSSLVNQGGLCLIITLLPIQLAWSGDETDFVLNAVAIYFVIQMDDNGAPTEFCAIQQGDDVTETQTSTDDTK